jgi:hypothetical protein
LIGCEPYWCKENSTLDYQSQGGNVDSPSAYEQQVIDFLEKGPRLRKLLASFTFWTEFATIKLFKALLLHKSLETITMPEIPTNAELLLLPRLKDVSMRWSAEAPDFISKYLSSVSNLRLTFDRLITEWPKEFKLPCLREARILISNSLANSSVFDSFLSNCPNIEDLVLDSQDNDDLDNMICDSTMTKISRHLPRLRTIQVSCEDWDRSSHNSLLEFGRNCKFLEEYRASTIAYDIFAEKVEPGLFANLRYLKIAAFWSKKDFELSKLEIEERKERDKDYDKKIFDALPRLTEAYDVGGHSTRGFVIGALVDMIKQRRIDTDTYSLEKGYIFSCHKKSDVVIQRWSGNLKFGSAKE